MTRIEVGYCFAPARELDESLRPALHDAVNKVTNF